MCTFPGMHNGAIACQLDSRPWLEERDRVTMQVCGILRHTRAESRDDGTITEIPRDHHSARIRITDVDRCLKRCRIIQWPIRWIQRIVDLLKDGRDLNDAADVRSIYAVAHLQDRRVISLGDEKNRSLCF